MYKSSFFRNLSLAGITVSAAISFGSEPAAANTTFECIRAGQGYATIAVASTGERTEPLITWTSGAFIAGGYTPERRCHIVSGRLTSAVAQQGGYLSDMLLTTGEVNGLGVVCWVNNNQSTCNSRNLLVTISPGRSPGEFLANFLNRGADPFTQGTPGQESVPRTTARFGAFVERQLDAARRGGGNTNTRPPAPQPPEPSNRPRI